MPPLKRKWWTNLQKVRIRPYHAYQNASIAHTIDDLFGDMARRHFRASVFDMLDASKQPAATFENGSCVDTNRYTKLSGS